MAKVNDLMNGNVITVNPHDTVGHVRTLFSKNSINSLPVVNSEEEVVGIISTTDLVDHDKDGSPVSQVMTERVFKVSEYSDVSVAARMMRNHHIHHLAVTHEQKIVGIISAFDLLQLVEDRRFVMKNPSTPKKKRGKRSTAEGP